MTADELVEEVAEQQYEMYITDCKAPRFINASEKVKELWRKRAIAVIVLVIERSCDVIFK